MGGRSFTRREVMGAIGVAAGAAAVPVVGRRAAAATRPKLSMGYQATLWGAPAIVAEQEGLFKGLGVDVTVHRFSSGKAVRDAMISGSVDMGSLGATPFIVGVAKGEVAAIGAIAYAGRTLMVVAGKGSGVKSVADLKGKKVGSQRGSITDHIFQNKILQKAGLSARDVQVVNVSFQDHVAALASGSIDAFAGVDPYPTIAEHQGLGVILTDYGAYDITPVLLAINRPVLERNEAAVVEFLKGWLKAVRLFEQHPEQAAQIVWRDLKQQGYDVPQEVIRKAVGHLDVNAGFVPELKGYLVEQAKVLVEKGQISSVPDFDRALVRGPLERAMKG